MYACMYVCVCMSGCVYICMLCLCECFFLVYVCACVCACMCLCACVVRLLCLCLCLCLCLSVCVQEIYNEKVLDLFHVDGSGTPDHTDLPVREDAKHRVQVVGLSEHVLESVAQFTRLYAQGGQNRTVAATKLNAHSSRSHAVLTFKIERVAAGKRYVGKLHLIDLAGFSSFLTFVESVYLRISPRKFSAAFFRIRICISRDE
jgi:hypothetical protein